MIATFIQSETCGTSRDMMLMHNGIVYWNVGAVIPVFEISKQFMGNLERTAAPFIYEAVANDN